MAAFGTYASMNPGQDSPAASAPPPDPRPQYPLGTAGTPNGTDQSQFTDNFLYNPDDPGASFNNALRSMGLNANSYNPYLQYMRRAAPGLSLAYQTHASQGYWGDPQQVAQGNGTGGGFGEYLRQSLNGVPGNNGVRAQLQYAQSAMPDVINAYRQQSGSGQNLQNVNPYLYSLAQQFAQNNGQGTSGAFAAYNTPFMTSQLSQAYGTGLENARQQAMYNYGQNPTMTGDIWQYLLGM